MIILELPWPPSINSYWTLARGIIVISTDGKRYRSVVRETIVAMRQAGRLQPEPIVGRLGMLIEAHEPTLKRQRDLDNPLKCLLDSFQHADLYANDSKIRDLRIVDRGALEAAAAGKVIVKIWQLPKQALPVELL